MTATWRVDIGTKLYINGADVQLYGVPEVTTSSNNITGLSQPGVLFLASDPTGTGGRDR